jgi:predicted DNA-binding transcriptional regulator AlpA
MIGISLDATLPTTARRKRAHVPLPPDFNDPVAQDKLDDVTLFASATGTGTSTIWRFVADGRIKKPIKVGRLSKWTRRYIRQIAATGIPEVAEVAA